MSPAVSVIIPTYNQANFLQEALQSVLQQTFSDWEAVVVNNFSDDHTVEVVENFADQRIQLINFRNQGIIGAARNVGLRHASAELIAFLDSDDIWHEEKLAQVKSIFDQQPEIDLVCHDESLLNEAGESGVLVYGPHVNYRDLLFRGNCLSTSAVVVRRAKFLEVGGFSENPEFAGAEDYDLWLRLARADGKFFYHHQVLGKFRVFGQGFTSKIDRHCQHILNVLDAHYAEWQPQTPYFRFLMRRQRGVTMRSAARSFIKQGEHQNASRLLQMAVREDALSWKTWVLSLANLARVKL